MNRELNPHVPQALTQFSRALMMICALFAFVCPALADGILNAQEQAIANHMINDSNQHRPSLTLDPILASVARARAADMAKRNYFAHVNPDGYAANYLVEKAGYPLPSSWGDSPDTNYIESIAAGYGSADSIWDMWMGSSPHRTHILGLNSFYAAETSYGVGYYYDPNSTYKYYWVVITAPPRPAPNLTVVSPTAGARVTVPAVAVAGTTSKESATARVEVRVENANGVGVFQQASGTTQWSVSVNNLAAGPNTLRIRSLNSSGAVIAELTRAVTYVVMGSLNVSVSGSGSVTAGFAGVTSREVGRSYTITATPAPGFLFSSWSGGMTSARPVITFAMRDGLSLQANFVPNPFVPLRGSYYGLVTGTSHTGFVRAAAAVNGAVTGRLILDGAGYAFTARLDMDGTASVTIPHVGQTPLTLNLHLDLTGGTEQITGTISDGTFTAGFSADHATFNAVSHPAPQAGRYTLVFAPDPNASAADVPQGNGFATVSVAANGQAIVSGRMADGTPFIQGSTVSKTGSLPLYLNLSGAPVGSAATGTLVFRSSSVSDLDGSIRWKKTSRASDVFYPEGFQTQLPSVGARYTAPASGSRVLNMTQGSPNATAALGDGNLEQPISVAAAVTDSNQVIMPTPGAPSLSARINPVNGLFSGTFVYPVGSGQRAVLGAVLQKQNAAFGFFRGIDQSGYFSLAPTAGN